MSLESRGHKENSAVPGKPSLSLLYLYQPFAVGCQLLALTWVTLPELQVHPLQFEGGVLFKDYYANECQENIIVHFWNSFKLSELTWYHFERVVGNLPNHFRF